MRQRALAIEYDRAMRYWAAIGLGIVAALVALTYGPRRDADSSFKPRTATVVSVGSNGAISQIDIAKGRATEPRLITYIASAIVAVAPVGWVLATRRSRRERGRT